MHLTDITRIVAALDEVLTKAPDLISDEHRATLHRLRTILEIVSITQTGK